MNRSLPSAAGAFLLWTYPRLVEFLFLTLNQRCANCHLCALLSAQFPRFKGLLGSPSSASKKLPLSHPPEPSVWHSAALVSHTRDQTRVRGEIRG